MLNRIRKETKTTIYNEQPVSKRNGLLSIPATKLTPSTILYQRFSIHWTEIYIESNYFKELNKILTLAHHWFVILKNIIEVELPFRQGFGFYYIKSPFFIYFLLDKDSRVT